MKLRRIRNALFSLLALVLILLATVAALLETETGSRWLVTSAARVANISVGDIDGNLRTGLDLEFIDYAQGEQHIRAEQVSFRWRPATLLYRVVTIQSLYAERVLVQLPPSAPKTKPAPPIQWPNIRLPVRVSLDDLRVRNIDYVQGATRLHWDRLSGSISMGTFQLRYKKLALRHRDYRLQLSGASALGFPYKTEAELLWQWQAAPDEAPLGIALAAAAPEPVSLIDPALAIPPMLLAANPAIPATPAQTTAPLLAPVAPAPTESAARLLYKGKTQLQGSLLDLQLHSQISSPVAVSANTQLQLLDQQRQFHPAPPITLALEWQQQTLPAAWWIPKQPAPVTSGKLTAQGSWNNYQAQLLGDIHLPQAPLLIVNAAAQGDLKNIQVELLHVYTEAPVYTAAAIPHLLATTSSQARSSAAARVSQQPVEIKRNLSDEARGITLSGNVRWLPQLQWHVDVAAKRLDLASLIDNWPSDINGSFTTRGERAEQAWNMEVQDLNVDGEVRGVNLRASGNVKFDGKDFRSEALNLVLGANQLQVKGVVGEQLGLVWDLRAPMLQQLDNSLSGSVISQGELRGNRKNPLIALSANIEKFNWGAYGVDKLDLSIKPQGAVAAKTAATAASTSSTPAATSGAGASAQAEGKMPMADRLRDLGEAVRNDHYQLALTAKQLHIAGNRFSSIQIDGSGSIARHELQALLKSTDYGRVDFKVAGNFDGREWQGKLPQLALKAKNIPRWWLTSGKPIRVSADAVQLGDQCLTTRSNLTAQVERADHVEREQVSGEWQPNQSPASNGRNWLDKNAALPASRVEKYSLPQLCVQGEWVRTSGATANVRMDSVPLRQFLALFKTEVYFAGVMDGSLALRSSDFSLLGTEATLKVSTRNAELRYQYADGATEVYAWRNFGVQATLKQGQLAADAGMDWVGYGTIHADTKLDLVQSKISSGKLQAEFSNLAPLETLMPFTNDIKGDLRADLTAGGTFAQPYVLGSINLSKGAANLPRLGVDLSNIELNVNSTQAGNISLQSQLQSGDGKLSLSADLVKFGTPEWDLQGVLSGADFKVINLNQLKANLSPNIKLNANRELIHLSGETVIPWLRANIKRLPPSATKLSNDAVIVNEQDTKGEAESPIKVFSNLTLTLGKDVEFKGFGLSSKLTGQLNLLKDAQRQFFTSGYVSVVDGSYRAYGQSLTIERGRLVFQGPYENPGLDIRASREIKDADETKVGLEVSGTLQNPVANVFSVPSTAESQAMMMLVTGKPAGEASKADASVLLGAMTGVGVDTDGSVGTKITQLFHLDELEVKSDEGIEQSQLWMGKYLTPKLLVRYAVGIFDSVFTLGMEYHLTNNLRLEAESGETQSVDVVYKIER